MGKINLVAVQASMKAADYDDAEAFHASIMGLTEQAVEGLPDYPTLLAFPETIGLPLVFMQPDLLRLGSLPALARAVVRRDWRAALALLWRYRSAGAGIFVRLNALAAYRAYVAAFSEAARSFGVTLVAGSSFLPPIAAEASRRLHIIDQRVYNASYTFAPTGTQLGVSHKVYLTSGAESWLVDRGRLETLQPYTTPVGQLGVAVCLDGFYSSVLDRLDGLGAQIIVQPSANYASWTRPWPPDTGLSEGEAWLTKGLRAGLQNRLNLRYGVNPMLVGGLWGMQAEGRSSILSNSRYLASTTETYEGVLVLAASATEPEFVRATVPALP